LRICSVIFDPILEFSPLGLARYTSGCSAPSNGTGSVSSVLPGRARRPARFAPQSPSFQSGWFRAEAPTRRMPSSPPRNTRRIA
jgi:hypothetical protein